MIVNDAGEHVAARSVDRLIDGDGTLPVRSFNDFLDAVIVNDECTEETPSLVDHRHVLYLDTQMHNSRL